MLVQGNKSESEYLAQIGRHAEALSLLLKSEGYQLLESHVAGLLKDVEGKMASVSDGDAALRLLGSYTVLKDVHTFAVRTLAAYQQALRGQK